MHGPARGASACPAGEDDTRIVYALSGVVALDLDGGLHAAAADIAFPLPGRIDGSVFVGRWHP